MTWKLYNKKNTPPMLIAEIVNNKLIIRNDLIKQSIEEDGGISIHPDPNLRSKFGGRDFIPCDDPDFAMAFKLVYSRFSLGPNCEWVEE